MNNTNLKEIEQHFSNEITQLNFKRMIIKAACNKFSLSEEVASTIYYEVRDKMKKSLFLRAWTYLLLGSIFFGVGLFGTFVKTGFIFYGALLAGFGMLITSIGYFRISILKS